MHEQNSNANANANLVVRFVRNAMCMNTMPIPMRMSMLIEWSDVSDPLSGTKHSVSSTMYQVLTTVDDDDDDDDDESNKHNLEHKIALP